MLREAYQEQFYQGAGAPKRTQAPAGEKEMRAQEALPAQRQGLAMTLDSDPP